MRIFITSLFLSVSIYMNSQTKMVEIYNPETDAKQDLINAIHRAKVENKQVMIQIGGNWCPWCIKLHNYINQNPEIDSIIKADYVFIRINYSPENKNLEVLNILDFPQRFGFPVIVVLDEEGNRLHTQDTGYLEENNSYSYDKLKRFLLNWNKQAITPKNYQ